MKELKKVEHEKESYSVEQVIEFTLNILNGIMVPPKMAETIGIPIAQAIGNLEAVKQVMANAKPEGQKEVEKDGRETDIK